MKKYIYIVFSLVLLNLNPIICSATGSLNDIISSAKDLPQGKEKTEIFQNIKLSLLASPNIETISAFVSAIATPRGPGYNIYIDFIKNLPVQYYPEVLTGISNISDTQRKTFFLEQTGYVFIEKDQSDLAKKIISEIQNPIIASRLKLKIITKQIEMRNPKWKDTLSQLAPALPTHTIELEIGKAYIHSNQFDLAKKYISNCSKPETKDALTLDLAEAYLNQNNFDKAGQLLQTYNSSYFQDRHWLLAGLWHLEKNEIGQAITNIEKIESSDLREEAYVALVRYFLKSGEIREAESLLEYAFYVDPHPNLILEYIKDPSQISEPEKSLSLINKFFAERPVDQTTILQLYFSFLGTTPYTYSIFGLFDTIHDKNQHDQAVIAYVNASKQQGFRPSLISLTDKIIDPELKLETQTMLVSYFIFIQNTLAAKQIIASIEDPYTYAKNTLRLANQNDLDKKEWETLKQKIKQISSPPLKEVLFIELDFIKTGKINTNNYWFTLDKLNAKTKSDANYQNALYELSTFWIHNQKMELAYGTIQYMSDRSKQLQLLSLFPELELKVLKKAFDSKSKPRKR